MEPIGKNIPIELEEKVKSVKQATHFNVLEVRFQLPQNEMQAEICYLDADGNAVGPAAWVTLTPFLDKKQINAKVKIALQGLADGL